MSQWYEHRKSDDSRLWLYSERGLMSYLFCQVLAEHFDFVLDNSMDMDGVTLREEIGAVRSHTILTEYELGPRGFGSPDGGILTAGADRRCFIFVEAKQRSFADCCEIPSLQTAEALSCQDLDLVKLCSENTFNSSINGQLELRWRFANAFRASVDAGENVVSERHVPAVPSELLAGDRFYWRRSLNPDRRNRRQWRHVDMAADLACLYLRLKEVYHDERRTRRNGFYLLSVTFDESAPDFTDRPRLYDRDGIPLAHHRRVFWLDRRKIEANLTPI